MPSCACAHSWGHCLTTLGAMALTRPTTTAMPPSSAITAPSAYGTPLRLSHATTGHSTDVMSSASTIGRIAPHSLPVTQPTSDCTADDGSGVKQATSSVWLNFFGSREEKTGTPAGYGRQRAGAVAAADVVAEQVEAPLVAIDGQEAAGAQQRAVVERVPGIVVGDRAGREDASRVQRRLVEVDLAGQHQHRDLPGPGGVGQRADHLAMQ